MRRCWGDKNRILLVEALRWERHFMLPLLCVRGISWGTGVPYHFCGTSYPALSLLFVLPGAPHVFMVGLLIPLALNLQVSTLGVFPTLLKHGTSSSFSWQGINTLSKQSQLTSRWGFLPIFSFSWGFNWSYHCRFASSTFWFPFISLNLTFVQIVPKPWKELFPLRSNFRSFESSGRESMVTFQSLLHLLEVNTLWRYLLYTQSLSIISLYGVHGNAHLLSRTGLSVRATGLPLPGCVASDKLVILSVT